MSTTQQYQLQNWKSFPTLKARERVTCEMLPTDIHVIHSRVEYTLLRPYQITDFTTTGVHFRQTCQHPTFRVEQTVRTHSEVKGHPSFITQKEGLKYQEYLESFPNI